MDKPCIKCGSTERYKPRSETRMGDCAECARQYVKEYRRKYPDRVQKQELSRDRLSRNARCREYHYRKGRGTIIERRIEHKRLQLERMYAEEI